MLTYAYGTRVDGVAGLPERRQQRREMDGISEANFGSFVLGLCVQDTAGWRSPDRSGLRGSAKSGCNWSMETARGKRKLCLREQKSGQ